MNFLETPQRRRVLFFCLYLSEGAPIGFLWEALPTQLRLAGVEVPRITWLAAVLVLPWTFKFAWAPLVDLLRGSRWNLKHWIIAAQAAMGLTLLPLLLIDPVRQFSLLAGLLLVHAFSAATQDVAIDALCIEQTASAERGRLNGWMQAGLLTGRSGLGGGALLLSSVLGRPGIVVLLLLVTTFSMLLVATIRPGPRRENPPDPHSTTQSPAIGNAATSPAAHSATETHGAPTPRRQFLLALRAAVGSRNTWLGLAFAVLGGAAYEGLGVVRGPFLVDHQISREQIGWFLLLPSPVAMIGGALLGGFLADRFGRRRYVALAMGGVVSAALAIAAADYTGHTGSHVLLPLFGCLSFGIGLFTAASYALFMDLTHPVIAATQFSAFMGGTNACESWAAWSVGRLQDSHGYAFAFAILCVPSLLGLALLPLVRLQHRAGHGTEPES